jgi:hypothetical protein
MRGVGYPAGVPTPYVAHVHPYPTRFHGGIWTRPVFGYPQIQQPASVFIPGRDIDMRPDQPYTGPGYAGLGRDDTPPAHDVNVGEGIFRPGGYGGGVFDGNLAGAPALGKRAPHHRGVRGMGDAASDADNYPYGKYSAQTKQFQDKLNVELLKNGLCPIVADGKLGPASCGAATTIGWGIDSPPPSTCQDFKTPTKQSDGCGTSPVPIPATSTNNQIDASLAPTASLPLLSSSTKKMLGFAAGAIGAVAVVYYVKKKRSR